MENAQYIIYRFFFQNKNTFRGNFVWNLPKNFHEDRIIIQCRSMYTMFFFSHFGLLIRMVVSLMRYVNATSWDAAPQSDTAICPKDWRLSACETPVIPHGTSEQCRVEVFKGAPQLGPHCVINLQKKSFKILILDLAQLFFSRE